MNIKKILIVDDTPTNIEAAKAYFTDNKDYECIYATDRKTAEELLLNCNALITDRQIPYQEGENKEDYKLNDMSLYEHALKTNGYILLARAMAEGIPSIMLSEHGGTMILKINDLELAKIVSEKSKIMDPYSEESFQMGFDLNFKTDLITSENISKQDPKSWELAINQIDQQFKLNERPIDIPKIKLK